MKKAITRKRLAAVVVVLIAATGVVAAASSFTAGSGVSYETGSGLTVSTNTDHTLDGSNPFNGSDTVTINNVSFTATGQSNVTVDQFTGTWTNLTAIDTTNSNISIDPAQKSAVTVGGGVTALDFKDVAINGSVQLVYSSSSSGTISITGLPANTEFAAATTTGDVLITANTSSSGTASIPVDSATGEKIVLLDPSDPTLSDLSPADGAELTDKTVTLSANVTDSDFDSIPGDNVTVEFVVDGSVVGDDSVSSNGTASVTISDVSGGEHKWFARASDTYGSTTIRTANRTYKVPSTLYLRPVNKPDQLINGTDVSVTGRFFSGNLVFERETGDGKLNLTGLPVDRTYVLALSADRFYKRTVIIDNLYEQSSIYLLNSSKSAYYTEFALNDLTGDYTGGGSQTRFYIERPINSSGTLEWETVAGDYLGAEGRFEVDLQQNTRYRLRLKSGSDQRVIGSYTATRSGVIKLTVGEVRWNVSDDSKAIRYSSSIIDLTDGDEPRNGIVHFQYEDPTQTTAKLQVVIHEDGNPRNEILNTTFDGPYGTFALNETLNSSQMTQQWAVSWTAYNSSGTVIHSSTTLADGKQFTVTNPVGPKLTPVMLTVLFLFVAFLFGGRLSSLGSLAVVGVAGVMWWLGFYTAGGGVIVFAAIVGVISAIGGGGRR